MQSDNTTRKKTGSKQFADRIRSLRAALGDITQPELAKLLGVGRDSVERWEQERSIPRSRLVICAIERLERRAISSRKAPVIPPVDPI